MKENRMTKAEIKKEFKKLYRTMDYDTVTVTVQCWSGQESTEIYICLDDCEDHEEIEVTFIEFDEYIGTEKEQEWYETELKWLDKDNWLRNNCYVSKIEKEIKNV